MERESRPPLKRLPDGRLVDTRYRFKRGDRVRITDSPHAGKTGTADSAVGQLKGEDGKLGTMAGYHVQLDDGSQATVRWDALEPE